MIRRILILTLLYCYIVMPALAADGIALDPSRTLFTARQLGMGGVSIAFSDDANGVFSNPAQMTDFEFPQLVGASRKLLLDETQYTLFGCAVPTDWGTFGLGYTGMNTAGSLPTMLDPATNRIMIDPNREAISYDNSVFALSYARKLREDISVGGNLKFFNQSFSGGLSSNASATGIDLSATYQPLAWLTAGANLQNLIEGNLQWDGGSSDKIGGFYKVGCKVNILGSSQEALRTHEHKLYGGIDIDIPHSTLSGMNYHLGTEYFPLEKIALRAGFNMDQNGTGLTLGVGLINGGFRFDYAFVQRPGLPGDAPHYFSLSYIGERVVTVTRKLKAKEPYIKFSQPRDRFITDQDSIVISAEARARRILDQKTTWTVTAISETQEVKKVTEIEDLKPVYINGIKIEQVGTIETSSPLGIGRNVFEIVGYTSPEALVGSGEVKVLRIIPFSDTPMTHWAIEPVALCVTLGLVKGYPDQTFRPEKGITRAELVTLLVRSMPVRLEEEIWDTGFSDVSPEHWAAKYIAYGAFKELITGYPDGTFKPSGVLTRAEGVTILARYSKLTEEVQAVPPFPDLKPDFWANKYIAPAKEAGMLKYLEGKNFEPSKPFPRSEACEVLYRTPQVKRGVDQFWKTGVVSAQKPKAPAVSEPKAPVTQPETKPVTPEAQP